MRVHEIDACYHNECLDKLPPIIRRLHVVVKFPATALALLKIFLGRIERSLEKGVRSFMLAVLSSVPSRIEGRTISERCSYVFFTPRDVRKAKPHFQQLNEQIDDVG